jgi:GDP-L-fucose synthase
MTMQFDSNIYIPGHRGLVGSAILRKLKEHGYTSLITRTSRQLDLRNQAATERFFKKERPDYVFLAAAKVGGILANDTYRAEFIYDNIMIAANVIHASYTYGVKKLLNLGSSCIYPKMAPQPMKEEFLLTGELEPTNEPYAIAKISAIKLCRYYNEQYGTNFISVMPTNLYGPNDNFDLETSHVLPALIRKFHLGKLLRQVKGKAQYNEIIKDLQRFPIGFNLNLNLNLNLDSVDSDLNLNLEKIGITSEYVRLWGSGSPYREFLYVDDLAEACLFLMNNYKAMRPAPGDMPRVSDSSRYALSSMRHAADAEGIADFINVGTGKDITIKALAEMVKEIVGFEGEIEWDPTKPDGTPKKLLDVSKISSLGWKPKVGLEEGIKRTYNWYLKSVNS